MTTEASRSAGEPVDPLRASLADVVEPPPPAARAVATVLNIAFMALGLPRFDGYEVGCCIRAALGLGRNE
jgi:hypothetical protein